MLKMEGWEIALIVLVTLIIIGFIIVIILAVAGVFGEKELEKDIGKLLASPFSMYPQNKTSDHVTATAKDSPVILNDSKTVKCSDYTWTYNSTDNTIEWGGDNSLVITVDSKSDAIASPSRLILASKGTPNSLNQWEYNSNKLLRWCLKSNKDLCMSNDNNILNVKKTDLLSLRDDSFLIRLVTPLKSPECVT